jgi:glutathione synthase/RimK-type ligase-like ATP-grasp enzyme
MAHAEVESNLAIYGNTKWGKTRFLNLHDDIRRYIPETKKATKSTVGDMLERYGMVYVKPSLGTGGHGVMKAEAVDVGGQTSYRYKLDKRSYQYGNYDDFYRSMSRKFGKRTYLVQKGIRMLRFKRRPFDVRVMVQKNERGVWEHTGTIGRLAHPARAVTNYHSGGTPLPLDRLLKPHYAAAERVQLERKLSTLGVTIAKRMQRAFPWLKEIGVDFGLDKSRTPWIFEVNTRPYPHIFLKLGQPSTYRKIMRLSRLHGRAWLERRKKEARARAR